MTHEKTTSLLHLVGPAGRLADAENGSQNGECFHTVRVDPDISQLLEENNFKQFQKIASYQKSLKFGVPVCSKVLMNPAGCPCLA